MSRPAAPKWIRAQVTPRREILGAVREWAKMFSKQGIELTPDSAKEAYLVENLEKICWRAMATALLFASQGKPAIEGMQDAEDAEAHDDDAGGGAEPPSDAAGGLPLGE